MKIKKLPILESFQNIEEVYFTNKNNLEKHYYKHVISDEDGKYKMEEIPIDEYNELANTLSEAPAGHLNDRNATVIGYVTEQGRLIKYDKSNNLVVIYVDDNRLGHETIALYKQPLTKFFRKLNGTDPRFKFKSHLPKDQSI